MSATDDSRELAQLRAERDWLLAEVDYDTRVRFLDWLEKPAVTDLTPVDRAPACKEPNCSTKTDLRCARCGELFCSDHLFVTVRDGDLCAVDYDDIDDRLPEIMAQPLPKTPPTFEPGDTVDVTFREGVVVDVAQNGAIQIQNAGPCFWVHPNDRDTEITKH